MRVNRFKLMSGAMLLSLAALAGLAAYLALHRIYQVDEAQNLYMIRVLATGQADLYFTNALLWMLGPMSWLVRGLNDAASIFNWSRLLFLGVFLLNIWLLALATGRKPGSFAWLAALFGAATLAPLWDYGFEIRHDNLILTGLLLMWWLGRSAPRGRWSYVGLGCLSAALPFLSFKALAYAAPISLALLLFPPPGHGQRRPALWAAWAGGAGAALLAIGLAYVLSGAAPVYLAGVQAGFASGAAAVRFDPAFALDRLPRQVPLLRELVWLAFGWIALMLWHRRAAALTWDGPLPEALLLTVCTALLLLNPTPFPYNLVNLVPFAYLLAFRVAAALVEFDWNMRYFGSAVFALLLLCHVIPFLAATPRHLAMGNARQKLLMHTAESLTDPRLDRVYDGAGLVPTRASIGRQWYNHTLNKAAFASGKIPSVAAMLAARPAAVVIRSYRTDMMPEADQQFMAQRYVPLSDDLWLLGQVLAPGGGTYQVLHPGRYLVLDASSGKLLPLRAARLGGLPLAAGPVTLAAGPVQLSTAPEVRPAVVWIGPALNALPAIGKAYHQRVFRNFY
jgi:hypothetical protein